MQTGRSGLLGYKSHELNPAQYELMKRRLA
jgi:hypothetical protein